LAQAILAQVLSISPLPFLVRSGTSAPTPPMPCAPRLTAAALSTSGLSVLDLLDFQHIRAHCSGELHTPSIEMHHPTTLATITTGTSILAAAAPALCGVCCSVPLAASLLPSLQFFGGGKLLGGGCMHKFGRKLAYYFVIPLGLISNGVSYPQHQNLAVTATSLTGISAITATATFSAIAPYRVYINPSGCAMMLGSSYYGNLLARENGRGCSHCDHTH